MNERTCNDYMEVAEYLEGKTAESADLAISTGAITSRTTPPEVREDVEAVLARGEKCIAADVVSLKKEFVAAHSAEIERLKEKISDQGDMIADLQDALESASAPHTLHVVPNIDLLDSQRRRFAPSLNRCPRFCNNASSTNTRRRRDHQMWLMANDLRTMKAMTLRKRIDRSFHRSVKAWYRA